MKRQRLAFGIALSLAVGGAVAQGVQGAFAAKLKEAGDKFVLTGSNGWLFFVPELHYLSSGKFWGPEGLKVSKATRGQDPLPAIVDFKQQLDKKGIALLVVPVPAKAAIYPDQLLGGKAPSLTGRVDNAQAEFLKVLGQNGVQSLDLTPKFLEYRQSHPDVPLYAKTDTHWSGGGIKVAVDAIMARVKQQPWYAAVPKKKFTSVLSIVETSGDLARMESATGPAREKLKLTQVDVVADRNSPLLLLGDSHNLIYSMGGEMLAAKSGFPENLALQLGFAPDVIGVMGSGATSARGNLARRGDNLAGKKMVIWIFTARDFTETAQGWNPVPVIK